MKTTPLSSAFLSLCLLFSVPALSQSPEEKGLTIAKQQKANNVDWNDSTSEMKMILRTASGRENIRFIKVQSLEVKDDGDKSLMVFDQPKDVQGTSFLSFSHIGKPDDQWIYLPALKRIKRISSKKKSGSFMGSEFSYEDLSSFEVEKYSFKFLRDEEYNGKMCHVLESTPTDKYSGYSKQLSWIDHSDLNSQKVEFYDKRGELLKTMTVENYEKFNEKFWRPIRSVMQNNQTGKSTTLEWNNIVLNTGLKEADFSKNALKSAD
jgi:outer membrane lipoprotein-sorting protein